MIGGVRVKATEGFAVLFVVAEKGLGAMCIVLLISFLRKFRVKYLKKETSY